MVQDEDGQNSDSENLSKLKSAGEVALLIGTQMLSLIQPVAGAIGSVGFSLLQAKWQQQFAYEVQQKLEALDQTKLDRTVIESEEFRALLIQVLEIASKTASDSKRKALAQALISCVVPPTSRSSIKEIVFRRLSELEDVQIQVVAFLANWRRHKIRMLVSVNPAAYDDFEKFNMDIGRVRLSEIEERVRLGHVEALVVCQELERLGLALSLENDEYTLSPLGGQLVAFCVEAQ